MQQIKQKFFRIKQLIGKQDFSSVQNILNNEAKSKDILSYKDIQGRSLLFYGIFVESQQFNMKMSEYLIKKGANAKDKQINKQTVIFYIASSGKINLLKYFLKFQFDLNQNDYMDQTPLFYAAKINNIEILKLLISYGCDVNHKDKNHQTCLFYAARQGRLQNCKLFSNSGCNMLHQDRNRNKAIHFAKLGGHQDVVDFLATFKYQAKIKKQYQQNRDSSLNQKKKKKQISRNDYILAYCNQHGQLIQLTGQQLIQFSNSSLQNKRIYEMLRNPQQAQLEYQVYTDKKFQKIGLKIINHFWKHQNSHFFYEPVDYIRQNIPDYPKIIKYPMDFGTVKRKLIFNAYDTEEQFRNDMNLVFDNCILYNGMQSPYGKIAMEMKLEFNTMYNKQFYSN